MTRKFDLMKEVFTRQPEIFGAFEEQNEILKWLR
jgi:hypothetical protein